MASIKSTKERILINETKAARNKAIQSKVKAAAKRIDTAIVVGDKATAQAQLINTITEIDKATTKGVYHKNTAFGKVSRLTKAVNAMT